MKQIVSENNCGGRCVGGRRAGHCLRARQESPKKRMSFTQSVALVSLFLCLLAACTPAPSTEHVAYTSFPDERRLQGEAVLVDTALFRYPFRVRVQGDRAAVLDLHGTDCFVHLFSYPDFRYVASCAPRGEGPDETLSAETIRWEGNALQVLDADKSELTVWQEVGDSLVRRSRVKLDEALLRAQDFATLDDATLLIPDYSGDHRFCLVSPQGKLLRRWGTIPTENAEALRDARPALAQAWRSFVDYNPRNGVLAAATQLGEVVEVWNLRDSTHVVLHGPGGEPEFQVSQGYALPTGIMGFSDVQVGESAVYAVFHGQTFRDIMQAAQQGQPLPDGGKYLCVFSLEGKPLARYELDHYVYGISVDERTGTFLATDVNRDEPVWKYSFR